MEAGGRWSEAAEADTEAEAARDKVTFTQSLPNLAFIDTNEVMKETEAGLRNSLGGHNEAMYDQMHHNWPSMRSADNSIICLMVSV